MIGDIIHIAGVPHRVTNEFPVRHLASETPDQRSARIKNGKPEPTYGYTVQSVEKIDQKIEKDTHT